VFVKPFFPSSEGISTSKTRLHRHPTHGFGSDNSKPSDTRSPSNPSRGRLATSTAKPPADRGCVALSHVTHQRGPPAVVTLIFTFRTIGISGPPGMIVGSFLGLRSRPRLPPAGPGLPRCRHASGPEARRQGWPRRCFPVVGKDLRVALTEWAGCGSGRDPDDSAPKALRLYRGPSPRC